MRAPAGKWIANFSEESGEYALHLRDQKGMGEVKKIQLGNPPSFFYSPTWSPDSRKIAYSDKRGNVWYVDIERAVPKEVDTLSRGSRIERVAAFRECVRLVAGPGFRTTGISPLYPA